MPRLRMEVLMADALTLAVCVLAGCLAGLAAMLATTRPDERP